MSVASLGRGGDSRAQARPLFGRPRSTPPLPRSLGGKKKNKKPAWRLNERVFSRPLAARAPQIPGKLAVIRDDPAVFQPRSELHWHRAPRGHVFYRQAGRARAGLLVSTRILRGWRKQKPLGSSSKFPHSHAQRAFPR